MAIEEHTCPACRADVVAILPGRIGQCRPCRALIFHGGYGQLFHVQHRRARNGVSLFKDHDAPWYHVYAERIARGLNEGVATLVFHPGHQAEFVDQLALMDATGMAVAVIVPEEKWRHVVLQASLSVNVRPDVVHVDRAVVFGRDGMCPARGCKGRLVINRTTAECPLCEHSETASFPT